jgi:hypothetical protein
VVRRVLKGDVGAEPEDVSFALFHLGLLVVVCLEVVMRYRVCVVRIGFVDVLRRDGDRRHHPVGHRENKDDTVDGTQDV